MSGGVFAIALANLLELALGAGLLPMMGLARTWRELAVRLPLAYAVGLAATGIAAAHLSLLHVAVGRVGLPLLSVLSLAFGARRISRVQRRQAGARLLFALPAYLLLAVSAAYVVPAARLFAVKPLFEIDGWAVWAMRARALYEYGHPIAPVFTDSTYPTLQYPLLMPSLEAIDFRFMGTFDGTLVHLQLLGFAIAFVGGAWTLLRARAFPITLAAGLLAVVSAPTFFAQLQTNFVDVPLAIFVALGVAALAAWLREPAPGLLPAAALFLGAAALTKNEGEMFALTAFIAAVLFAPGRRRRAVAYAALGALAIDLPWRIWVQAHHLPTRDYALSNLFNPPYLWDHRGRVWPAAHELLAQISNTDTWSLVLPFVLAGLLGAFVLREMRPAAFGVTWLLLGFGGLVAIYWIQRLPLSSHLYNSSDRTIDSLMIGGALLVPVVVFSE